MQSGHIGVHRMEEDVSEDVSKDVEEVIEATVSLLPSAVLERLWWQSEGRCLMAGKKAMPLLSSSKKDRGSWKLQTVALKILSWAKIRILKKWGKRINC